MIESIKFLVLFLLIFIVTFRASAQNADFSDGSDLGWIHLDPLGGLGAGPIAFYEIVEGGYRISAKESPSPSQAGPSRAASLRQEVIYQGDLFLTVDFRIPDPQLEQAVGVLVFVQPDPALGATSGYSLNFQPAQNDFILNLIVNEEPTELAKVELTGTPGDLLRLTLLCENGCFRAKLFNVEGLLNPIASIVAKNTTYTAGTCGLFVFADTDDASGNTDAIFDNYRANALDIPALELALALDGGLDLRWPSWARHYRPQISLDLTDGNWEELVTSPSTDGGSFVLRRNFPVPRRAFYRLARAVN